MVYPTHGAGSLCSTGIASTPWSTIGYERRHDPLLAPDGGRRVRPRAAGRPADVPALLRPDAADQPGRAAAARRGRAGDRAADRRGARARRSAGGALVVDARPAEAHAAGHIPGSLSIPAGSSFGTWLGWVVDADRPVVLVVDDLARPRRARAPGAADRLRVDRRPRRRRDARRGGGRPAGRGRARASTSTGWRADARGAAARTRPLVIDVRQASEYEAGHVPGARPHRRRRAAGRLDELPRDRPIATICASGLPLERRRLAAARGRLRARRVGAERASRPGSARGYAGRVRARAARGADGAARRRSRTRH